MGGSTAAPSGGQTTANSGTLGQGNQNSFFGQILSPMIKQVIDGQQPQSSAQNPNITAPATTEPQTYTPKYDSFGGTNP